MLYTFAIDLNAIKFIFIFYALHFVLFKKYYEPMQITTNLYFIYKLLPSVRNLAVYRSLGHTWLSVEITCVIPCNYLGTLCELWLSAILGTQSL